MIGKEIIEKVYGHTLSERGTLRRPSRKYTLPEVSEKVRNISRARGIVLKTTDAMYRMYRLALPALSHDVHGNRTTDFTPNAFLLTPFTPVCRSFFATRVHTVARTFTRRHARRKLDEILPSSLTPCDHTVDRNRRNAQSMYALETFSSSKSTGFPNGNLFLTIGEKLWKITRVEVYDRNDFVSRAVWRY